MVTKGIPIVVLAAWSLGAGVSDAQTVATVRPSYAVQIRQLPPERRALAERLIAELFSVDRAAAASMQTDALLRNLRTWPSGTRIYVGHTVIVTDNDGNGTGYAFASYRYAADGYVIVCDGRVLARYPKSARVTTQSDVVVDFVVPRQDASQSVCGQAPVTVLP